MRILSSYFLVLLFVFLLLASDVYFARQIRSFFYEINRIAQQHLGRRLVTFWTICFSSLLLWLPPLSLIGGELKLEYRIFISIVYWILLIGMGYLFVRSRSTAQVARKVVPPLVLVAFVAGLCCVPLLILFLEL